MKIQSDRLEAIKKAQLKKDFDSIDRKLLAKMSDKELAEWQSKYESNTSQTILAEHEWQRRLTSEQVKATRFGGWMGLAGAVVGALITLMVQNCHHLSENHPSSKTNSEIEKQPIPVISVDKSISKTTDKKP